MGIFSIKVQSQPEVDISGERVLQGSLVYLSDDGNWYKSTASVKSKCTTELKIITEDSNSGEEISLLSYGEYIYPDGTLVPGDKYYVSVVPGEITNTIYNNSANVIRYVGTAKTDAILLFNPDQTYISDYNTTVNDIKIGDNSIGEHTHTVEDITNLNTYTQEEINIMIGSIEDNVGDIHPVGLEGQVYYITEDATNNIEPSFILKEGTIVDSQEEFDSIVVEGISLENVFTTWYLFAHADDGVHQNPSSQLSPPNFPGLDSDSGLTQALYDSGNTWGYDPVGDRIYLTQNFGPYTGFISPKKFSNYTLEATLSSTNSDDDNMGIVIGFYVDPLTGYEHTLSVIMALNVPQGATVSYGVYYNFSQVGGNILIADGTLTLPFPTPYRGWIGSQTRLRVIRTGDTFSIKGSQFGSTVIDDITELIVDLTSDARLTKFMTASQVGFSAKSQARAYFSDIYFTGFQDYIFFPDGSGAYETWEWNPIGEVYFLQDPKTVFAEDYFGRGRLVYSPIFSKTYYITENDEIIKIGSGNITNSLERTSSLLNDGEILGGGDRFLLASEIEGLIPPTTLDTETVLINGDVVWQSGLTFYVYATKYKIDGILREGFLSATVTLGVADVTNGRIDSFIIRNNGLGHSIENDSIVVIPGVPSSEPAKQVLDNELELEISFATIDANATEPTTPYGLDIEVVYEENVEWTVVGATGTINAASTSLPITGTVSILHSNPEHQKSIYFTTPTPKFTSSNAVLQFNIKLQTVWEYKKTNGTTIDVYLWKNNNRFTGRIRVGSDLGLNFDPYNITTTQTVFIRLDRFSNIFSSNDYNKIQFQYQRANNDIFRIDNIKIVEGYGGSSQEAITIPTKTSELLNDGANGVNPFINALDLTTLNSHLTNYNNPHSVSKTQVGLSNVDNTSDVNKPVSTATQTALNGKEDISNKSQDIEADKLSTTKYGSVKAIYDWAVGKFQAILISGTNIRTVEGNTLLGSTDIILPIKASKTFPISSSFTLTNAYNNGVIYLNANATITIPTGLMEDFEWNVITKAGFTLTYVLASGVTALNNTGLTMAEKLMMTGKKIGTTEVYFLIGI